jgi:AraC-like DNA-binding protein
LKHRSLAYRAVPKVSRPLSIHFPASGIVFAESQHAQNFQMAPRTDAFQKLLYVVDGRISYQETARPAVQATSGALLLVPASTQHVITDIAPSTLLIFCFNDDFLGNETEFAELWRKLSKTRAPHIQISQPMRLQFESLWRRAILEQSHIRLASETAIRAIALQVLVLLARTPTRRPEADVSRRLEELSRELAETFYEPWTLDKAAARAGISRRHFSEKYREFTGHTFADHLIQLRINHAATLLKTGKHSISGVIFACGFGDVSHFYRLFRKKYNLPPKQWLLTQG